MKIAGVVVWYNPSIDYIENIKSYISYVDKIYVYDNSEYSNMHLLLELSKYKEKIEYIQTGENKGIAFSLNYTAKLAINEGYEWLLTMDQDSYFFKESFSEYLFYLKDNKEDKIGILAPIYIYKGKKNTLETANKKIDVVITSGNLVNLKIWDKLDGFNEKLFIDEVDHEYCYRLKEKKYEIIQVSKVILEHSLGKTCIKNIIFGIKINYTEHSPFRKYYIWRNRLYVRERYQQIRRKYSLFLIKDFIKILFLEAERKEKLKSVWKAYKDFKKMVK